jgi:hypothetical protein
VLLDPPYRAYESLYGSVGVADAVESWARANPNLRIAICGHAGDYKLPGWEAVQWKRKRLTYSGKQTTNEECIWFSPACLPQDAAMIPARAAGDDSEAGDDDEEPPDEVTPA